MKGNRENSSTKRTTVVLPKFLDENLEAYALQHGLAKGEIIVQEITKFLKKKGYQTDKRPNIRVSYQET